MEWAENWNRFKKNALHQTVKLKEKDHVLPAFESSSPSTMAIEYLLSVYYALGFGATMMKK